MSHLTPEQLTAFRDGELREPDAIDHVAHCEICRDRLQDARVLRTLLRTPGFTKSRKHPNEATLAEYFDGALSPRAVAKLEFHLRNCEDCSARMLSLQKAHRSTEQHQPSKETIETARLRFSSPHKRVGIGTALVDAVSKLMVRLIPAESASVMGLAASLGDMSAPAPPPSSAAREGHPSSAKQRRQRLQYELGAAPVPLVREFAESQQADLAIDAENATRIAVRVNKFIVTIVFGRVNEQVILDVAIEDSASRVPVKGIELTLISSDQDSQTSISGREGRVRFSLSSRESRLLMHTPPVVNELTIQLSSKKDSADL